MMALFAVSAVFNAKRGRELTEQEHKEQDSLRAQINCGNSEKDTFLVLKTGFFKFSVLCYLK